MDKTLSIITDKVVPALIGIIAWFVLRTVSSIDDRLARLEDSLSEVPAMKVQISSLFVHDDQSDERINELYRMVADLPRNSFNIKGKKK